MSNKETLLRCVLEIITYYHQLDKIKFIKNFKEYKGNKINMGILIPKNGRQHIEYMESLLLKQLIEKNKIRLYVFDFKEEYITNIEWVNRENENKNL